jgi:hypothetical protein
MDLCYGNIYYCRFPESQDKKRQMNMGVFIWCYYLGYVRPSEPPEAQKKQKTGFPHPANAVAQQVDSVNLFLLLLQESVVKTLAAHFRTAANCLNWISPLASNSTTLSTYQTKDFIFSIDGGRSREWVRICYRALNFVGF